MVFFVKTECVSRFSSPCDEPYRHRPKENQVEKGGDLPSEKKTHHLIFHASSPARFDGPCRRVSISCRRRNVTGDT